MTRMTRRSFLGASASAAVLAGLVGCNGQDAGTSTGAAAGAAAGLPTADQYPLEADAEGVEAKWTSEETRDGWTRVTNPDGPELGVMDTAKIIQVDGLAFKDLDGSGKIDLWEDWRQPIEDRAAALAASLSSEDAVKLMFHGGTTSAYAFGPDTDANDESGLEGGSRAGVSRLNADQESFASGVAWINHIQEVCEGGFHGIPYLNSVDPYSLFGIPQPVTLSAAMDKDLWRKAGMWMARGWRAIGARILLGSQVDVYSNPIGCRLAGSVCEDPAVNRDFTQAFAGGMQSTWGDDEATDDQGWGKDSVAAMLKHFAGEGCVEGGRNDHTDQGKWNVFPGGNFNAHLIPFLDGGLHLDSKTGEMASVMPCYGIAYDPNDPDGLGEHVGSAYSKHNLSILRNAGWDGMICTDWQIINMQKWGVANLTEGERFKKLIDAGIDQYGGAFAISWGLDGYKLLADEVGEEVALARVQDSARRVIRLMMTVDLFENPYSDRSAAADLFGNAAATDFGLEACQKSVVMLKNKGNVISKDGIKGKVYIPQKYVPASFGWFGSTPATVAPSFAFGDELGVEVVTDAVGEPSGPAGDDGEPTLQPSDITSLTAEDLKDVQYAIVEITDPRDANNGTKGGVGMDGKESGEPQEWLPVTRQYRPYTADGANVRKESLNPADEFGEKQNRAYFGKTTTATNESDLDLVIATREALPKDAKLICIVDAKNPLVFSELEPYCDAILLAMGENSFNAKAYADIISGKVEPSGLLPFQMPKDMDTIEASFEDVPRDLDPYKDSEGNAYDFCFGLNWSGVIDDDRVKTYGAAPLTEPESPVKADA